MLAESFRQHHGAGGRSSRDAVRHRARDLTTIRQRDGDIPRQLANFEFCLGIVRMGYGEASSQIDSWNRAHPFVMRNSSDHETTIGAGCGRQNARNRPAVDGPLCDRRTRDRAAARAEHRACERGLFAKHPDFNMVVTVASLPIPDSARSDRTIVCFGEDQVEERIDRHHRGAAG